MNRQKNRAKKCNELRFSAGSPNSLLKKMDRVLSIVLPPVTPAIHDRRDRQDGASPEFWRSSASRRLFEAGGAAGGEFSPELDRHVGRSIRLQSQQPQEEFFLRLPAERAMPRTNSLKTADCGLGRLKTSALSAAEIRTFRAIAVPIPPEWKWENRPSRCNPGLHCGNSAENGLLRILQPDLGRNSSRGCELGSASRVEYPAIQHEAVSHDITAAALLRH